MTDPITLTPTPSTPRRGFATHLTRRREMNATHLAHDYATAEAATVARDADFHPLGGNGPAVSRHAYQTAYDRAAAGMTWCDLRGISYATAAEAITIWRDRGSVRYS